MTWFDKWRGDMEEMRQGAEFLMGKGPDSTFDMKPAEQFGHDVAAIYGYLRRMKPGLRAAAFMAVQELLSEEP